MKKFSLVAALVISLYGCASFLTTTGTGGTSFGMSKEAVVKVMERKGYKIISEDENTVVVDGMQEQLKQPAIKTFYFENGSLVSVNEKIK